MVENVGLDAHLPVFDLVALAMDALRQTPDTQ